MRSSLLFILLVLILASPVSATVFPCSSDSSEHILMCTDGCQDQGVIDITAIPTGADILINPTLSTIKWGKSELRTSDSLGPHSFTVSLSMYNDYSGYYQICSEKITYVTVSLTPSPSKQSVSINKISNLNLVTVNTVTSLPTTTPVPGVTTQVTSPTTAQAASPASAGTTIPPVLAQPVGTASLPDTLGSLSITTTPAGATILIDGVLRGASPATIPGISAGSHTLLLKPDGYQDFSMPVPITAGTMNEVSTGLTPMPARGNVVPVTTATGAP